VSYLFVNSIAFFDTFLQTLVRSQLQTSGMKVRIQQFRRLKI
jgi:hypothetical protein